MARTANRTKPTAWSSLCACTWLLVSCATATREQKIPITVVSDPPGARVEANGQFIGNTPLKTEIHRYRNPETGAWYGFAINAFPTRPGQCSQQKVFPENTPMATHMYFDMSLCPVAPARPRSAG
ncbi:MAG: PEGA domain-containing protein [Bdellovibrionia bacterium]